MQNKNLDTLDQFSTAEIQTYLYKRTDRENRIKVEVFKNRIKSELELKFDNCLKQFKEEYQKQFSIIKDQIKNLSEISERYGVPFDFSVYELFNEDSYKIVKYIPKSYMDLWSELDRNILAESNVYGSSVSGWNTSSLSC